MKFSMGAPSRTSRHGFVEMHRDQESIHTLAAGASRGAGAGGMNTTKLDACQFASAICASLCGAVLTMESCLAGPEVLPEPVAPKTQTPVSASARRKACPLPQSRKTV